MAETRSTSVANKSRIDPVGPPRKRVFLYTRRSFRKVRTCSFAIHAKADQRLPTAQPQFRATAHSEAGASREVTRVRLDRETHITGQSLPSDLTEMALNSPSNEMGELAYPVAGIRPRHDPELRRVTLTRRNEPPSILRKKWHAITDPGVEESAFRSARRSKSLTHFLDVAPGKLQRRESSFRKT